MTYMTVDDDPLSGVSYYRLRQTDIYGSSNYSDVVTIRIVIVAEPVLYVFPNPVNNHQLNIHLSGFSTEETVVMIVNLLGEEVFSMVVFKSEGEIVKAIDIKNKMHPGVYFVAVSGNNQVFNQKLIVTSSPSEMILVVK